MAGKDHKVRLHFTTMLEKSPVRTSTRSFILFFFFSPSPAACRILVLRPGVEPGPAVRALSPNHWTLRALFSACHGAMGAIIHSFLK